MGLLFPSRTEVLEVSYVESLALNFQIQKEDSYFTISVLQADKARAPLKNQKTTTTNINSHLAGALAAGRKAAYTHMMENLWTLCNTLIVGDVRR